MALRENSGATGVRSAQRHGERAAGTPQFEWLARAGLAARGVVYAVIGFLALKLALGDGGKATNQQGALKAIVAEPFGQAMLVILAVGLAGYAIWRLLRAALGHGAEQGDSGKERLGGAVSGLSYLALCVTAVKLLSGAQTGSGTPKEATGGVLDWTGGPYLVGAAGLLLIGVAGYQAYQGMKRKFLENSKTGLMSRDMLRWFTALGVFGHVARGVVFALMGYGLVKAALAYDPDKAVGLDGALRKVQAASYGPWLLGLVALGLLGFAVYSALDARYRKV